MANEDRGMGAGSVFMTFVAGAALGAGLALLLAPRSGKETREKLRELADDAVDRIKETARNAQERVMSVYDEGRDQVLEKKSMITSAIEAGKAAMEQEKERFRKEKA